MIIEKRTMKTAEDMLGYAGGVVGIAADLAVFGGLGQPMEFADPWGWLEYDIDTAEKIRLGEIMVARWQTYIEDCKDEQQTAESEARPA